MSLVLGCASCGRPRPHRLTGSSAECSECGARRPVEGDLIPVVDMQYCDWCRAWLPVDHVCPAGSVGCMEREPSEDPCGGCDRCLAAQTADLARYGSPIDLDYPRTP